MSGLRFSAVVGQDEAKHALVLAAVEPLLAGVLLRGDKGSAKTTLARGLAALLPGDAPFVELPLGATEDRVIGSLDLAELLTTGQPRFRPGLIAAAHGGVLYVDEINLLADHLVDALLDVAVSGVNRVERDGLSHCHPARFVLVASMNPEEGELRPQLLDRFGLAVDVAAPGEASLRAVAVRRQLTIDRVTSTDEPGQLGEFDTADRDLRRRITLARTIHADVADEVIDVASRLALAVGAEGLRADLMLCRAAAAAAAVAERSETTTDDVRAVAGMVLGHRRRRRPFDEPGITPDELDSAWAAAAPCGDTIDGDIPAGTDRDQTDPADEAGRAVLPPAPRRSGRSVGRQPSGGFAFASAERGRFIRDEPLDRDAGNVDARATAVTLAARRVSAPGADLTQADLRGAHRERRHASLVVFVVDASTSMGTEHRMAATKAAVTGLLGDAYRRRGRVALITFKGDAADVVLRPTASIEVARARLAEIPTGGATPVAAGLDAARQMVDGPTADRSLDHHVVVITDGRATVGSPDPIAASHDAMRRLAMTGAKVMILDTETGPTRLGLAKQLAASVDAAYAHLDEMHPGGIDLQVRRWTEGS